MTWITSVILSVGWLVSLFTIGQGCLHYNADARRRRALIDGEFTQTESLRAYFTACMADLVENKEDWQTQINFAVLDSVWYANTLDFSCIGNATASCWQVELNKYVDNTSVEILESGKECIGHYAADATVNITVYQPRSKTLYDMFQPMETRDKTMVDEFNVRKKRQAESIDSALTDFPGSSLISQYAECIMTEVERSIPVNDTVRPTNYTNLAVFVANNLIYPCGANKAAPAIATVESSSSTSNNANSAVLWPYTFLAITKTISLLREPLDICGTRLFPPNSFWATWSNWSQCSIIEGNLTQRRSRTCRFGANPAVVSDVCPGNNSEMQMCLGA